MHTNIVNNKGRIESTLKEVVQDKDNNNFIVPLNSYIFDHTLSVTKRINLMYDCIQIIINSYEKTKLKWYQTSFFQFVMLVITIGSYSIAHLFPHYLVYISIKDSLL